jgi:hypothetical protein
MGSIAQQRPATAQAKPQPQAQPQTQSEKGYVSRITSFLFRGKKDEKAPAAQAATPAPAVAAAATTTAAAVSKKEGPHPPTTMPPKSPRVNKRSFSDDVPGAAGGGLSQPAARVKVDTAPAMDIPTDLETPSKRARAHPPVPTFPDTPAAPAAKPVHGAAVHEKFTPALPTIPMTPAHERDAMAVDFSPAQSLSALQLSARRAAPSEPAVPHATPAAPHATPAHATPAQATPARTPMHVEPPSPIGPSEIDSLMTLVDTLRSTNAR